MGGSKFVPKCLACEGPIKDGEQKVTVIAGRGRSSFLYRHKNDSDCARYLSNLSVRVTRGSSEIDEPDYTENGAANARLTDRHLRQGMS